MCPWIHPWQLRSQSWWMGRGSSSPEGKHVSLRNPKGYHFFYSFPNTIDAQRIKGTFEIRASSLPNPLVGAAATAPAQASIQRSCVNNRLKSFVPITWPEMKTNLRSAPLPSRRVVGEWPSRGPLAPFIPGHQLLLRPVGETNLWPRKGFLSLRHSEGDV